MWRFVFFIIRIWISIFLCGLIFLGFFLGSRGLFCRDIVKFCRGIAFWKVVI